MVLPQRSPGARRLFAALDSLSLFSAKYEPSLNNDQLCPQRTRLLESLQHSHHIARRSTYLVNRSDNIIECGGRAKLEHSRGIFSNFHCAAWNNRRFAAGKGIGLAYLGILANRHRQLAMGHRRRQYLNVLTYDNGAGTGID